jgi:hypothetical protein
METETEIDQPEDEEVENEPEEIVKTRKLPEGVEPIEELELGFDIHEEGSKKNNEIPKAKPVDVQEENVKSIPDIINLDNPKKVDSRLQNLLKEFEMPVIKNKQENKIEIQTPEDKVDNIEVYKKLVQKYKSANNEEIEKPEIEDEELE